MKRLMLAGASFVMLAACGGGGGGDRAALIDSCIKDGESQETCTCIVDSMEEKLSPALFGKVADAAKEDGKNPDELMGDLSAEEQAEFMTLIPEMMTCAMGAAGLQE